MTRTASRESWLRRMAAVVALAITNGGCAFFGGVEVESVATSVQRPANVALYVAVTDRGEPVTHLMPENFRLYENEELLAKDVAERILLDRAPVTSERVLLLVELSGEPNSGERRALVRATEGFVEKLAPAMAVTVAAYDGGAALRPVGDFARGGSSPQLGSLAGMSSDRSRNLNGAIVAGLELLDARLRAGNKPVRLGTLVVLARGPDLAARTSDDALYQALDERRYDVIGIGIGEDTPHLSFARAGVIRAQAADTLPIAFEEAAARVVATHGKYYVVAYCSPARAGERRVRVEVSYTTREGEERTGDVTHDFDAKGFGSGCQAGKTPRFVAAPGPSRGASSGPGAAVNRAPEAGSEGEVVPPPESGDYAE